MYAARQLQANPPPLVVVGIVGVGLLVLGLALGVGRGKVPDGWERAEAEVVVEGREGGRRRLPESVFLDVSFRTSSGEDVVTDCDFCDGNVGDTIDIAYDPADPRRIEQPAFARSAALASGLIGGAITAYVGWTWLGPRSPAHGERVPARLRRHAGARAALSAASSGRRRGRSRGRPRP